ncbi:hypothetical protein PGQ11_006344 [Apiospora arundinis]|uniref:Secreted protein n=1 Tax=Apiospora arundinis TaxID=335852 RepID=A0ABR2IT67_9PEZI
MAGVRFRLVLLTRATLVATSRLGGHQALVKTPGGTTTPSFGELWKRGGGEGRIRSFPSRCSPFRVFPLFILNSSPNLPVGHLEVAQRGSRTPPHRHSGLSLGLDRQPAPHVAQALVVDPQDPVLVPEIPDLGHEAPELVLEPQGAVHVRVGLVHGLVALLEDLADDGREGHGGVGALELGRRGHDFLKGHHQRHGDLLNTIESPLFLLQEIPLLLKLGLPVNGIEPARSRGEGWERARRRRRRGREDDDGGTLASLGKNLTGEALIVITDSVVVPVEIDLGI